jgi:dinuclear metal center YbgI/SA1388 family protein
MMILKLKEIAVYLESIAPLTFQESYDNSGLQIGSPDLEVNSALLSVDVTEEVLDEAIHLDCNLIISHHPIIFSGLKSITGKNNSERAIIKAIKNNIALYAAHTNFDAVLQGVNSKICEKLNVKECKILQPSAGNLKKLVVFIPKEHAEKVRTAIFEAGAGQIGNYDSCSYNVEGLGSFKAGENTNPFVGQKGVLHFEKEIRFETIFPQYLQHNILNALFQTHPYEEVAYDVYPIENKFPGAGMGMVGYLESPEAEEDFLQKLKKTFHSKIIKHTRLTGRLIKKVAVCGGSGSFLIRDAIAQNADIFVTGDLKYHQFFDAELKIVIADIGHYESEQFTKELFYELLIKKFPKFAVRLSEVNTNPVKYF